MDMSHGDGPSILAHWSKEGVEYSLGVGERSKGAYIEGGVSNVVDAGELMKYGVPGEEIVLGLIRGGVA